MIGRSLAHYKVVGSLGKGGMGEVYLAEDSRLGRKVALKTLPPEMAADPERRARFEREAKVVAALNHPNIVTIHSVEEHEGLSFITMEHVEGEVLSDLIPEGGMPLSRLYDVAVPLADALAAAHEKGITHRDLKPGNVMVTKEGRVKVLDFGLAKLADAAGSGIDVASEDVTATATAPMTVEGKILGTVAYMSPEQAEGKPVDARSDVFALGVLLYEMATGLRPFGGDSTVSTLSAILRDTPPEIAELNPSSPRHLSRIVQRCLAKEPGRRYQTALDVRNELESLRKETDAAAGERTSVREPTSASRNKRILFAGLSAVAILIAVVAGAMLWPRRPSSAPGEPAAEAKLDSIAVLPFANMSDDPANEYFSDGLADELLNVLTKLRGLRVAARTSSFQFKGRTGDVSEIGRQLNVATILEGGVRRGGDRVRVTAQLINAADGFHLWSETYDRELDDVFAIQEDIAKQVAAALEVTLLGGEATRLAERPTESLEAHDAYLLGQQRMARRRSDSLAEAVEFFRTAIDLDPDYALAYVGLADANLLWSEHGGALGYGDALDLAEGWIETALELDAQLGKAYAALGNVRLGKHNPEGAERAYRRAIELNPSDAAAYIGYGRCVEDPERRLELFRKALELDPLSPAVNGALARALTSVGRPEEALERYRRAIELDPGYAEGYERIAELFVNDLDDPEQAVRWYEKAVEVDPGSPSPRHSLAGVYQSQGRLDDAVAVLQRTIEDHVAVEETHLALAGAYEHFGRYEEAIEAIRRAIDIDPDSPWPFVGLAELHADRLGRMDEAVRWAQEALKRGTEYDNSGLLYNLAFWSLRLDDEPSAQRWWDRFTEAWPESVWTWEFEWNLLVRHGKLAESETMIRNRADPSPERFLSYLWLYDMRSGRYQDAFDRYERAFPELLGGDDPKIDADNLGAAINIAAALLRTGDRQQAELLLRNIESFIDAQDDGVCRANYRIEPVLVYALQGRTDEALAALRGAVDQHWRGDWRGLELDPNVESLTTDPRFAAILAEVRADLAQQRRRLAADGLASPL